MAVFTAIDCWKCDRPRNDVEPGILCVQCYERESEAIALNAEVVYGNGKMVTGEKTMLDAVNKPCFGVGKVIRKKITDELELEKIAKDATATWFVASRGLWSLDVYREKTQSEITANQKRFVASLDLI